MKKLRYYYEYIKAIRFFKKIEEKKIEEKKVIITKKNKPTENHIKKEEDDAIDYTSWYSGGEKIKERKYQIFYQNVHVFLYIGKNK